MTEKSMQISTNLEIRKYLGFNAIITTFLTPQKLISTKKVSHMIEIGPFQGLAWLLLILLL